MLGIRTAFRRPPSELLALIGIIHMQGLLEQAHQSTNAMFYEIFGNPVFSATKKNWSRFKFLIGHLSFDDHITRPTPWQHDRFAAFRKVLKNLTKAVGNF